MGSVLLQVPVGGDADNGFIVVEVDREDVSGAVDLAADSGGREVARASETLTSALDGLRPALQTMVHKLRSIAHAPADIEVRFGLKFGAETGVIFAKGTAEGVFEVTLRWSNETNNRPLSGHQVADGST
jgi:Trypsin-co-occurring domain 1